MNASRNLPKVPKKKKIDLKKFASLAKKVRKSFEEEEKYLEERVRKNENNNSPRLLPSI